MELINTLGRRKTSVARIYMKSGSGNITINDKDIKVYFPTVILQNIIKDPFLTTGTENKDDLNVNLKGGGFKGQAEALQLAISRALCEVNSEYKSALKAKGYMTRDSRMVERKKFGQPKARKKFQFSKR